MAVTKVEICGVNTSKLPVLSNEEKAELFVKIKQGDEEALSKYIYGNLRLVLSVVQRFNNRGESVDDIFQVGCIGLIKAIRNFDTERGVKFSTYAVPMITLYRNKGGLKMTRKQATLNAKKILSPRQSTTTNINISEVDDKITEMAEEINSTWTKEKVLARVEQYIQEYGIPTAKAFDEDNVLPSHTVIKKLFNKTAYKFIKQYFPTYTIHSKYSTKPKEYWLEEFKKEYIRLNAHGITDYNNRRNKNLPCAKTLQSLYGSITSNELLKLAGFEIVAHNNLSIVKRPGDRTNYRKSYTVESNISNLLTMTDIDFMTKLNDDLNEIIGRYL